LAASSIAARVRPEARSSSSHCWPRQNAANSSKPKVCCSMKAVSSTRALPEAFAASSASMTALHIPTIAAASPPART
jgi:hypothetical protein